MFARQYTRQGGVNIAVFSSFTASYSFTITNDMFIRQSHIRMPCSNVVWGWGEWGVGMEWGVWMEGRRGEVGWRGGGLEEVGVCPRRVCLPAVSAVEARYTLLVRMSPIRLVHYLDPLIVTVDVHKPSIAGVLDPSLCSNTPNLYHKMISLNVLRWADSENIIQNVFFVTFILATRCPGTVMTSCIGLAPTIE